MNRELATKYTYRAWLERNGVVEQGVEEEILVPHGRDVLLTAWRRAVTVLEPTAHHTIRMDGVVLHKTLK